MTKPSISYGFTYECDGKKYSFVLSDVSEESAKRRVASMAAAEFAGQVRYADEAESAITEGA